MTQQIDHIAQNDTARAFEELRGEVSLMRAAVEGLTAARERIPDYTATLGSMSEKLMATFAALDRIEHSPAMRLSPEAMTTEIVKAGSSARIEDARMLHEARDGLARAIGRIDGIVDRGQAAAGQIQRLRWYCAATALAVLLLWSILPGALARLLPGSWHVPEWMAARTIGTDPRTAGERLIAVADQQKRNGD